MESLDILIKSQSHKVNFSYRSTNLTSSLPRFWTLSWNLTLILQTCSMWWATNNASKWQINSAFKVLIERITSRIAVSISNYGLNIKLRSQYQITVSISNCGLNIKLRSQYQITVSISNCGLNIKSSLNYFKLFPLQVEFSRGGIQSVQFILSPEIWSSTLRKPSSSCSRTRDFSTK